MKKSRPPQYNGLPETMLRAFEHFSDPIAISSPNSRYLYANMAAVKLCQLKSPREIEGKYYEEVKSALHQNELTIQHWKSQDHYMIHHPRKTLTMLEIHPKGTSSPYINTKIPLYDEKDKYIGSINHVKYLEMYSLNDFIKGRLPGSFLLNKPDDFFTEKECELICLRLQGMNYKTISSILHLSPRTVENRIQHLYAKTGINNYTDFAQFCEKRELHRYIPRRFIRSTHFSFEGSVEIGSHSIDA